jgi:caffeoyl-CoA O-methyltransferase
MQDYSSSEDPVLEDLYRQTHIRFVNPNMSTGHLQGKVLEFLSAMIKPFRILEIGTFTGYSAICLARGLSQEGKLFTIDINDEQKEFAGAYFRKAGFEKAVIQITGKAQDIIPRLDQMFDLVYIDGDKREYCEYFNVVIDKVTRDGFIIADNILWGEKVLEKNSKDPQTRGIIEFNDMIRERQDIEKVIVPVRDGLMLIRKI